MRVDCRSSLRGSTQLLEELTAFFAKLSSFPGKKEKFDATL